MPTQYGSAVRQNQNLFRLSLIVLPFLSYLGLLGFLTALIVAIRNYHFPGFSQQKNGLTLILISLLMLINCLLADNQTEAFLQLLNFLPFFLLFCVLGLTFHTPKQLRRLTLDFTVVSTLIAGGGLLEFWSVKARASSAFGDANTFASYLILALGIQLGLLLDSLVKVISGKEDSPTTQSNVPGKFITQSVIVSLSIALNILAILASASRNGVVVAALELAIFLVLALWLLIRRNWPMTIGLGLLMVTSLKALLPLIQNWFTFSLQRFQLESQDLSDPRLDIWRMSIDLIKERPFFGWGLGGFKFIYPEHPLRSPLVLYVHHPHNFWLLMGVEAGLIIALALTFWVGLLYVRGIKALKSSHLNLSDRLLLTGYLISFSGCICFQLFDCTFYDARINIMNWLILAFIHTMAEYSHCNEELADEQLAEQLAPR